MIQAILFIVSIAPIALILSINVASSFENYDNSPIKVGDIKDQTPYLACRLENVARQVLRIDRGIDGEISDDQLDYLLGFGVCEVVNKKLRIDEILVKAPQDNRTQEINNEGHVVNLTVYLSLIKATNIVYSETGFRDFYILTLAPVISNASSDDYLQKNVDKYRNPLLR